MRGRVMALWAVAFLGSTPIGGPIAGLVVEWFGGRAGLVLGGVACLVAAVAGAVVVKSARKVAPQAPLSAPAEC
jgi:MFS family permease